MSEVAQSKTFRREDYIREEPFGTGKFLDPKGVRKHWDDDAYRLAVEKFLTSLGPGRVISVNVQDPTCWVVGRVIVWYWDWDKAGTETIEI